MFCSWALRCVHYRGADVEIRKNPFLATAITELIAAKSTANRRPKYIKSLELYLRAFARGRETHPIGAIGVQDLETWFASRQEASSTRSSNAGRLSSLFAFAVRRGYMKENPVHRMERITIERKIPAILCPAKAREAMVYAHEQFPRFIPWLALALFAGVRPEELDKLNWQAVNLTEKIITVDCAVSKVRRRRVTPLPGNLVEWLKLGGELPLPLSSRRRYVRRLRDHLGLTEWPQDVLRHTAASFMLATFQDAPKVAMWLGNSPRILLRDYQQIVSVADANEFWAVCPVQTKQQTLNLTNI